MDYFELVEIASFTMWEFWENTVCILQKTGNELYSMFKWMYVPEWKIKWTGNNVDKISYDYNEILRKMFNM